MYEASVHGAPEKPISGTWSLSSVRKRRKIAPTKGMSSAGSWGAQLLHVGVRADRMRNFRALVGQLDRHAHRFDGDENVREKNDGIDSDDSQRLQGNFSCEIDVLAEFQE
jgi:hypothetical protein